MIRYLFHGILIDFCLHVHKIPYQTWGGEVPRNASKQILWNKLIGNWLYMPNASDISIRKAESRKPVAECLISLAPNFNTWKNLIPANLEVIAVIGPILFSSASNKFRTLSWVLTYGDFRIKNFLNGHTKAHPIWPIVFYMHICKINYLLDKH